MYALPVAKVKWLPSVVVGGFDHLIGEGAFPDSIILSPFYLNSVICAPAEFSVSGGWLLF